MWFITVCAEEIICHPKREGDFPKWLFGALRVPTRVLECTAAEVKSRGKARAPTRASQQINAVYFIWPLRSGHSFCLPLLNRALTHSQKQLQYLHRARCSRLWFVLPHTQSFFLQLSITQLSAWRVRHVVNEWTHFTPRDRFMFTFIILGN